MMSLKCLDICCRTFCTRRMRWLNDLLYLPVQITIV